MWVEVDELTDRNTTPNNMDFVRYVNATAAESKEELKRLGSGSQVVYDPIQKRFGRVAGYNSVEHEVCDVEILGIDAIIQDVPLANLLPHGAFRVRAGHRVHVDGWIGIVKKIRRKVEVNCANGSILKFKIDEESCGTHDSYTSNGKLPTWWDRIAPDQPDLFSTVDGVPYPGNELSMTIAMELDSRNTSCFWGMRNRYQQLSRTFIRAIGVRRTPETGDVVRKVKIKKIHIEWEARFENNKIRMPENVLRDKHLINSLVVLAPLSQELCEEGSCRMYNLKGGESIRTKSAWLNERIQIDGAPRSITVDEVDNSAVDTEWLRQHYYQIGDEVGVKIICMKRRVEIRWEDGTVEVMALAQAGKLLSHISDETDIMYEINIDDDDSDSGSIEPNRDNAPRSTSSDDEILIPWLHLHFKRHDLVVDALREYPSPITVYGVIKSMSQSELTAEVDWYEVDENYSTKHVKSSVSSIFDLVHMDDVLDPLFRINWKIKTQTYGSEIVCSRFGGSESGFRAGYMRDINKFGQIVANSDSNVWILWPSDIERMCLVAYQTENGDWTHVPNEFATDNLMIKNFLPDYRQKQLKQKHDKINSDKIESSGAECFEKFPRLRKLRSAPKDHKYYDHIFDSKSTSSSETLHDPTVMAALVNQELKKTLTELKNINIYFCTYEDRPELVSALILGKQESVFEGGVFMFDICFPAEFPRSYPKLDYICYATNMNPILEDVYLSGPIKPLHCLNKTLDQMSLSSFGEPSHGTDKSLSNSSNNESYEGEVGQGDFVQVNQRTYNLTDFITYIYDSLFCTPQEELLDELFPGCLPPHHLQVYYSVLLGKKLEALSNMIQYPHSPWEEFMKLFQPRINELLGYIEQRLLNKEIGIGDSTRCGRNVNDLSNCEGSMQFLRRRLQYLKSTVESHSQVDTNEGSHLSDTEGVQAGEIGENDGKVPQERPAKRKRTPTEESTISVSTKSSTSSHSRFKVTIIETDNIPRIDDNTNASCNADEETDTASDSDTLFADGTEITLGTATAGPSTLTGVTEAIQLQLHGITLDDSTLSENNETDEIRGHEDNIDD